MAGKVDVALAVVDRCANELHSSYLQYGVGVFCSPLHPFCATTRPCGTMARFVDMVMRAKDTRQAKTTLLSYLEIGAIVNIIIPVYNDNMNNSSNLNDLYQENILDHANNPRNKAGGPLPTSPSRGGATHLHAIIPPLEEGVRGRLCGEGDNPSCGDSGIMCVSFQREEDINIISNVYWSGIGCAISQASMSILSEYIIGKSLNDLKLLMPGDIYGLLGIQITPSRVNCALLSYRAIEKIIQSPAFE